MPNDLTISAPVPLPAGLTPSQLTTLHDFAGTLTRDQALWASGYLAGRADVPAGGGAAASPVVGRRLTVLYGSETGHSAALAKALGARAAAAGRAATVADMASYKTRQLKDEQDVLIVTSTHGEGDPPQTAMAFFEFIEGRKAPRLPDVRFAVLALGDSTYERFCEAGKRLDRRLEELGAARIAPRAECDVDYEEPAAAWTAAILATLQPGAGDGVPAPAVPHAAKEGAARGAHDKANPFTARIIDNIVLTGRGSDKETRHIEISLADSGLVYTPGDALGMVVPNDPKLVHDLLQALAAEASAPVKAKTRHTTLGEAFSRDYEITAATPRFLEHWTMLSDAAELKALIAPGAEAARRAYLANHHVIDIVRAFPVRALSPDTLVAALRPMQPRLYSIASSLAAAPEEAHLTVATVRYSLHGHPRAGVASGYLADRGAPESTLAVHIQENQLFRLPAADAPIVMIGAGTGVAPYRAFLQEREAAGAAGRNWLFFGERHFRTDFLYQTEWQGYLKDGLLTRMDVAFSRDQAEKIYVQDRILEQGRDLYAWIGDGAHIYVCGDAARMAPDVHAALVSVVQIHGDMSEDAAQEYVRGLQQSRRYQRDVY